MRLHRLIPAAGVALLSAACGQKGPLYLPDKNAQVITSPASPPPAAPAPADSGAAPAANPPPAPGGTPSRPDDNNDQDSQPPK